MKVGILTQPLGRNYGGIIQAYALQCYLESIGHNVVVIDRRYKKVKMSLVSRIKELIRNIIFGPAPMRLFIEKHINSSQAIYDSLSLSNYAKKEKFDFIVVGSDQVWRPRMSPCITNYFCDFIEGDSVKCISYAASFGVDTWEFSSKETDQCKALIKKFKDVSVREESGISLCKEYFGIHSSLVLDPTLILDRSKYDSLIDSEKTYPLEGNIFCYFLDNNPDYSKFVKKLTHANKGNSFSIHPRQKHGYNPSPSQWLKSIRDAKYVITDSFHGTVFSIVFHKNFYVLKNERRGLARLLSLLDMCGLTDRLVSDLSDMTFSEIDWISVDKKLQNKREQSRSFIINNMC